MSHFIIIPFIVVAVTLIIVSIVISMTKRKNKSSDERLQDDYVYRKEPHSDQTTESPNRLSDNDITRG